MEPLNVVLYQNDARTAQALANSLTQHRTSVFQAQRREDIRPTITQHRAEVLVMDLETSGLSDVKRLHNEFPALSIVCTHRLADEELWAEALNQGAADMCAPWNTEDVVQSVMRERAHRSAA
ncbi:MAG TPA: hypothetical protein VLT90_04290 [Terriglobales bacterium]|nr:hypothetical protein [Terriglobales bacterium]